jgi:hypothetical protein
MTEEEYTAVKNILHDCIDNADTYFAVNFYACKALDLIEAQYSTR